ncbi:MAG: LOG family protein [Ignavibacteriae bacterium]|nr:MAG: LOG family protein [Ignavibacteriota bacterium]
MSKVITVFGSSRPREGEPEYQLAYEVGKHLALAGFTVCNGGFGGIMEASARGAKEAGGRTIGVTFNINGRIANRWIDELAHEPELMDRMMKLVELGDAYVVLKGGTGTLLELAAVWEFINKRLLAEKPIVIVGDFWNGVVESLRKELLWEGAGDCTKFIRRVSTPEECGSFLKQQLR